MQGTWWSVEAGVRLDQGEVKWESVTLGVGLKHNCYRGNQLLPLEMKTLKLDTEHVGLQSRLEA